MQDLEEEPEVLLQLEAGLHEFTCANGVGRDTRVKLCWCLSRAYLGLDDIMRFPDSLDIGF